MKLSLSKLSMAVALAVSGVAANAQVLPAHQTESVWFQEANANIAMKEKTMNTPSTAKNVILFVGDGMGIVTLTTARIFEGQSIEGNQGGEEHELYFENFPHTALVKTYNTNSQVPDSAGTMTAMVSGLKTDIGVFGYDEDTNRGDCDTLEGNGVTTYLEMAEVAGMSTGIISTARLTHATPGALYAKTPDRNYEDISDIRDGTSCFGKIEDIASQLISLEDNIEARFDGVDVDGFEVAMGGGRRHFIPKDVAFNVEKPAESGAEGDRTDGRNLPEEWLAKYADMNVAYVTDKAEFEAIDTESTDKLFGLFNESHMQYEADRGNDIAGEPSIAEMTKTAIEVLDNNPEGFFLMVESGRIDHAHHAGNYSGALTDTVALAAAVKAAYEATDPNETLILVTADHGHVNTMGGYVTRGNPILGKAVYSAGGGAQPASDGLPFTTVNYNNGRGFCDLGAETDSDAGYSDTDCPIAAGARVDLTNVNTTTAGYHQEAVVPLTSETHSGEDISIHATGPGSSFVRGTVEQSMVFHIMNNARPVITD